MSASTWAPYCGPGSTPSDWLARWNFDPWLLALLMLVAVVGWIALGRAGRSADRLWLAAGVAVLAVSFVSPLCALSSALFTARTVHHLLLVAGAALLLARAGPLLKGVGAATLVQTLVFWL